MRTGSALEPPRMDLRVADVRVFGEFVGKEEAISDGEDGKNPFCSVLFYFIIR